MIDLLKLGRLEERNAEDMEALRALGARYRSRVDRARELQRQAVYTAEPVFAAMTLPQLEQHADDTLSDMGVNVATLNSARREVQLARELQLEIDRRRQEKRDSMELIYKLRQYAGTTGDHE